MKVGDLVKWRAPGGGPALETIYVITRVYRSSVFNNSYNLFTISRASESLSAYKKDLILLEDTL